MSTGFFVYGSTIYGTTDENSDIDFATIGDYRVPDAVPSTRYASFEDFQELVSRCDPVALEGYSLQFGNYTDTWEFPRFQTDIDLPTLRRVISSTASNSFVKAKKKLTVEEDYDRRASMKSLFHSIRLLDFGCQIATHGHIVEFDSVNTIWLDIVELYRYDDYHILNEINQTIKPLYNQTASKFRTLAPKT